MDERIKMILNSPDENGECEAIELELEGLTDEIDARLNEIDYTLFELDEKIDKLTNHADKFDYAIAVASGILTGVLDAVFVGETNYDIEEVQKELEERYHTTNDRAYKHKVKKENDSEGCVSSAKYHRLEDIAHHPTTKGLCAAILVRFFRVAIFDNSEDIKTRVFFVDKSANANVHNKEMGQQIWAWGLATLSGVMFWLSEIAKKKEREYKNLPMSIKKLIKLLAMCPAIIEVMSVVDTWMGHIMSDVSSEAGVPGIILSLLKEMSMLPLLRKTNLPKVVDDLYANKKMNISKKAGVVFLTIKKQGMPIIINELIVRTFYFIRHLVVEYKEHNGFENIDWNNVIPFGNRTVERMMTIASGTFTAIDALDTIIKGNVLRLNFVGIGRFAVALGADTIMGLRKGKREKEKLKLKNEALYLMGAKLYRGEELLWVAVKDAEESIASLYAVADKLLPQVSEDLRKTEESILAIERIDKSEIENKNVGLLDDVLDCLN